MPPDPKAFPWLQPEQVERPSVEFNGDELPCSFSPVKAKTFPCLDPSTNKRPLIDTCGSDSPAKTVPCLVDLDIVEGRPKDTCWIEDRLAKTFPCLDLHGTEQPTIATLIEDSPLFASTSVIDQAAEQTATSIAARRLFFERENVSKTTPSISWSARCFGGNIPVVLDVSSRDGEAICRALSVDAEMCTAEIKCCISDAACIDVEDQCLFHGGAELLDEDFPLLGLTQGQRASLQMKQKPRNVRLDDGSWFCGSIRKHVSSSSSAPAYVVERGSEYIFHGLGTMRTTSGDLYSGQWRKHRRDGEGRVDYANGDFYQGMFRNNQRCGRGRFETAGGDIYKGEFASEQMSGDGELRRVTGETYIGQFLEGRYHGVGRQMCPDGGLYTGQFVSGSPHGECESHLADGSVYKGQFRDGHYDGDGIMSYADGHEYSGHFISGMMDGEGVYRSPSKDIIYEGQFVEDESHGRGRYFSPKGFMYEGEFCNDMFHGRGAIHYLDGSVEEGCFEDGTLVPEDVVNPISDAQVCALGG